MTQARLGRLSVLAAAVLWGTSGTAQALGPPASSVALGFGRIVLGSAVLAAVAARWDPGGLARTVRLGLGPALLAAVAIATYQAAFFSAVALSGVAVGTAVALGSAPVFTGLLARLASGERPERRWGLATVAAVAGVVLVLAPWSPGSASASPAGVALALLSGFTYGLYTVSTKRLLVLGAPTLGAMVVTLGAGALLLLPAVLAMGLAGRLRVAPLLSASGVLTVGWLGLATIAGAYLLYTSGLRRVPASTAGSLALGEPLTASLLGLAVLGERPAPGSLAGAALLIAGLLLLSIPPGPPQDPGRRRA